MHLYIKSGFVWIGISFLFHCKSLPKFADFEKANNSFIVDKATNKIWKKCMLGLDNETCEGNPLSLNYAEAVSACAKLEYNNLKFRLPSRKEYFWSFISCKGSLHTRDDDGTGHLSDYDKKAILAVSQSGRSDVFELGHQTCMMSANEEINGENYFPKLKEKGYLWTDTWSYKIMNDEDCPSNDYKERCAKIPLSMMSEKDYNQRTEIYHFILKMQTKAFRSGLAFGPNIPGAKTLDKAYSLCVADIPAK